jgi:hypothetical protein
MREVIKSNGAVGVSIMIDGATMTTNGQQNPPRMERKSDRVFLEHAAICSAREAGISILNL